MRNSDRDMGAKGRREEDFEVFSIHVINYENVYQSTSETFRIRGFIPQPFSNPNPHFKSPSNPPSPPLFPKNISDFPSLNVHPTYF